MGTSAQPTGGAPPKQQPATNWQQASPEEYNAAFLKSLGTADTSSTPQDQPQQTPIHGFWHRLLFGVEGQNRFKEAGRSVMRGFADTANAIGQSAFEFGSFIDRKTGLGEAMQPGFNAAYDQAGGARGFFSKDETSIVSQDEMNSTYGQRSDDPLAAFTESATQFLSGMALAGGNGQAPVGWFGTIANNPLKALTILPVTNIYAVGALVDATMFDPYEAQLAEVAAKAPAWTGLHQLGNLLSVKENDGALVARIKRSAGGFVAAGVLDGLIATARFIRSGKTLASSTATAAEKTAAQQTITETAPVIEQTAAGTHTAPGDHVVVRPTQDGQWQLQANPESPAVSGVAQGEAARLKEFDQLGTEAAELSALPARTPEQLARLKEIGARKQELAAELLPPPVNGGGREAASSAPTSMTADQIIDRHRQRATQDPQLAQEFLSDGPKYPTRGEAETQAAVMNNGVNERLQANEPISPEQLAQHRQMAKELLSAQTPAEVAARAQEANFNLSYYSSTPEVMAQIEAVSRQFKSAMDEAQSRPGGIPVEKSIQIARDAIGGMTEREVPAVLQAKLKTMQDQHAWLLASDMVMRDMGKKLAKMSEVLDARPHDAIAHEEARTALENFYGLTRELSGANSEVGRALRILQERGTAAEKPISYNRNVKPEGSSPIRQADFAQTRKDPIVGAAVIGPDGKIYQGLNHGEAADALEAAGFPDVAERYRNSSSRHSPIEEGFITKSGQFISRADLESELGRRPVAELMNLEKPKEAPAITAGMTHRDIAAQVRMIRMADGAPRDVFAVAHAAQTIKDTGLARKAMEVFVNFLLSGPKTVQTILGSGGLINMFEPVVRMAAGASTFNRALFQEGADIMWGNFKYLGDNLQAAAASFRGGRSILNPQPQHIAIGGVTGDIIRIPGRILTAADEFSRVTAYRAYVRAKSLRLGREQGLSDAALQLRVADDLRAAFDPATGIATLPEALRYAEVPTFSGPLGKDTFGGGLQTFVNNHIEAKFIAPFVKASVNIFRYVQKSIPIVNQLNAETRAALARGGEEAATIHARSALASTIYGFALYQAMAGNLTGKGPSDPELKKLWLRNHQPYSIKLGDSWVSYSRLDPLSTPLGLIADLKTVIHELGDKDSGPSDLAYGTVAALFYNLSSKTYLSGISQFADAWASNDPHATQRWMQNFAGNAVPSGVASINPDPVYRDVRSLADAIIARTPGWSTTLDPKFDIFGSPVMKTPGVLNRNQIFTTKTAGHSVEDDLLAIGRGLSPLSPKMEGGLVNLQDKTAYDNGTHKSPYIRMMELLRNPPGGGPSFRDAMTELAQSAKWNESSDGTSLFPGGRRWLMAAGLKEKYEGRALHEVMAEYPRLREQIRMIRRMKGAAITSGEQGVQQVQQLFGTSSR